VEDLSGMAAATVRALLQLLHIIQVDDDHSTLAIFQLADDAARDATPTPRRRDADA
jgi:hypothetical protein